MTHAILTTRHILRSTFFTGTALTSSDQTIFTNVAMGVVLHSMALLHVLLIQSSTWPDILPTMPPWSQPEP